MHKRNNMKNYFTNTDPGTAKAFLISLSTVLAVLAIIFINPPLFANYDDINAITGTSIASDTTLSISLSTTSLSLDLTPTSSNGTFVSTADDDTKASTAIIHVATNNITGYTLGIKASNPVSSSADKLISNNEKCENTPTSNKCAISSLSQPVSSEDYIDNTVEGIDLNNTWGYAPSYYNSTPNTTTTTTLDPNTNENITTTSPINYYPAPVQGDTIATTSAPNAPVDTNNNNNTNNNTNNTNNTNDTNDIDPTAELQADEYTIDYGIRIDYTPYTGTYSTNYNNQSYIITAVGNPVPYSVSYNANMPTGVIDDVSVSNMPTAQAGNVQSGDTIAVVLSPKVPTIGTTNPTTGEYEYAGYVFNGWCSVQPEVPAEINGQPNTQGYQSCPIDAQQPDQARLFQPGDSFGIDQTVDNTQILYATWGAPARVTFNSNGLVYSDTPTATENLMTFIPTYADGKVTGNKVNVIETGTYRTPTLSTPDNYILKGWSIDQSATEATYADETAITNNLDLSAGDNIELYAIWSYAAVITFNGNGNDAGNTPMADITIEAGQTEALPQNTYTKDGYIFTGWNTVQTPTEQDPGETYADQADFTAGSQSADVTLYAQWVELPKLYDYVKALVKKSGNTELTQTAADLQAVITKPTSNDPSVDTSNSGVYKYNASVFGAASDASDDYAIYYYRGILDSNLDDTSSSSYGSNGDGAYYPNYVRLGDTCWRIVRTTGSGGVKMIYNGLYSSGTTANSCANAQTNAQVTTKAFSGDSTTNRQAVRVGYTYNRAYATNTARTASIANVFGSDANPAVNNTDSTIKDYIEDEWFTSAIGSYESKLEPSAGYCNDRTVYDNTSPYTQQTEDTSIVTYGTSGLDGLNFGSYVRNRIDNGTRTLTLGCARSTVDLYTTSAATNGNKQLSHPVALLTVDETALAGSGGNGRTSPATQSSSLSYSSYLRSGDGFWLLSPDDRVSSGYVYGFSLIGNLFGNYVSCAYGVRPSISLNHETTVKSGTGTATDPWLINE